MVIKNGYMLLFGFIVSFGTFFQAHQSTIASRGIASTPDTTDISTIIPLPANPNQVQAQPQPLPQPLPNVPVENSVLDQINSIYGSATYNETSLRLKQVQLEYDLQLLKAQQILNNSSGDGLSFMNPANANLAQQISQKESEIANLKYGRSTNLGYSILRIGMLQSSGRLNVIETAGVNNKVNELSALYGKVYADSALRIDAPVMDANYATLLALLMQTTPQQPVVPPVVQQPAVEAPVVVPAPAAPAVTDLGNATPIAPIVM